MSLKSVSTMDIEEYSNSQSDNSDIETEEYYSESDSNYETDTENENDTSGDIEKVVITDEILPNINTLDINNYKDIYEDFTNKYTYNIINKEFNELFNDYKQFIKDNYNNSDIALFNFYQITKYYNLDTIYNYFIKFILNNNKSIENYKTSSYNNLKQKYNLKGPCLTNDGLFFDNKNNYLLMVQLVQPCYNNFTNNLYSNCFIPGKYYLTFDDYKIFYTLYICIINNSKFNYNYYKYILNFLERGYKVSNLLVDVDVEYREEIKNGRIYSKILTTIIKLLEDIITKNYIIENDNIPLYLLEKDEPSKNKENEYKDGVHIIITLPFDIEDRLFIIEELKDNFIKTKDYKNFIKDKNLILGNLKEDKDIIDKIIDIKVGACQSFMLYKSTKYLPKQEFKRKDNKEKTDYKKTRYIDNQFISPVYKITNKEDIQEGYIFSNYQYLLSTNGNMDKLEELKIKRNKLGEELKRKYDSLTDSIEKPKNKKNKEDINNDDDINFLVEFDKSGNILVHPKNKITDEVYNSYKYYTLKDINDLLHLVPDNKWDDYDTWMKLTWSAYSFIFTGNNSKNKELKKELIEIIKNHNQRGKGYDEKETLKKLKQCKKYSICLSTLKNEAKKENEEEYNKIMNRIKDRQILQLNNNDEEYKDFNIDNNKTVNYTNEYIEGLNNEYNTVKLRNLFRTNIIDFINYFYKYHVIDNNGVIYELQKVIYNGISILKYKELDFDKLYSPQKIEKRKITNEELLNLKNIKDIRLYNLIPLKKEDDLPNIDLYTLLKKTFIDNTAIIEDDPIKDIIYGTKYYNKYGILIKHDIYFNINKISSLFHYSPILKTNYFIKEDDPRLNNFKFWIDNIICKRTKDDNDINLIEQKRYYIYNYLKTIFLRKKNQTCLLLCGNNHGTGKSTFHYLLTKILTEALSKTVEGETFFKTTYKGEYTDNKLYLGLEEVKVGENNAQYIEISNILKSFITQLFDNSEKKYEKQKDNKAETCVSLCITSNYNNPIKIEKGDRRYAVFNCNYKFDNETDKDIFFNRLYNDLNNEEVIKTIYNYVKNTEFKCNCKDKDCIYHNQNKDFNYLSALKTPERETMIFKSTNNQEKFLIEFYNQALFSYIRNKIKDQYKDLLDKPSIKSIQLKYLSIIDDKPLINITYTQFYQSYKKYCETYKIKPVNSDVFKGSFNNNLLTQITNNPKINNKTLRIYKTLDEYKEWLIDNNLFNNNYYYNFEDLDEDYICWDY